MNSAALRLYDVWDEASEQGEDFNLLEHVLGEYESFTLAGERVPESAQPIVRALRGEEYKDVGLLVRRRSDGESRVLVYSGTRMSTDPPLSLLTIRDETDLWRSERRYRVAFEADPAPSVIVRLSDTRILEANGGMAELTGLDKSDLRERFLFDLKPLNRADDLRGLADRLAANERVHKVRRIILDAAGEELPVLLSARSIEVDHVHCGLFTFIDISELEAAQAGQRETQALLNATLTEHAKERAVLDRLATTDPLTGIANRRGLNIRLSEERARAKRYADTFSILVLDLDRFKRLNDTYGHDVGDKVLREVAQLLQDECREPDLAGRWGGEEFMMILPQIDLREAEEVAQRICQRVANTTFADGVRLTISIGVASFGSGDDPDGLFARADRALYDAKEGGRNRVEVAVRNREGV